MYVLWFTGLSGAGKSTIANALRDELDKKGTKICLLDGDVLRTGLNADLSYSSSDRKENIRRVVEVARLFSNMDILTLVSAITPFKEMREQARGRLGDAYVEIYVKADVETCAGRDPKGLYKKAAAGQIPEFTGLSSPYEPPENPDIILDTVSLSLSECTDIILSYLRERGL